MCWCSTLHTCAYSCPSRRVCGSFSASCYLHISTCLWLIPEYTIPICIFTTVLPHGNACAILRSERRTCNSLTLPCLACRCYNEGAAANLTFRDRQSKHNGPGRSEPGPLC